VGVHADIDYRYRKLDDRAYSCVYGEDVGAGVDGTGEGAGVGAGVGGSVSGAVGTGVGGSVGAGVGSGVGGAGGGTTGGKRGIGTAVGVGLGVPGGGVCVGRGVASLSSPVISNGPAWTVLVQRSFSPWVRRWKYHVPGSRLGLVVPVAVPGRSGSVSGNPSGCSLQSIE
jgi:hypothetical protein